MPDPLDSVALLLCVADPIRWAVLQHLSGGDACVCEIQTVVEVAPNLLSYHLRVLREAGLVLARRRGRWVDYRLAPDVHERLTAALPTCAARFAPRSHLVGGPAEAASGAMQL